MARLRVGDILIDDGKVSFQGVHPTALVETQISVAQHGGPPREDAGSEVFVAEAVIPRLLSIRASRLLRTAVVLGLGSISCAISGLLHPGGPAWWTLGAAPLLSMSLGAALLAMRRRSLDYARSKVEMQLVEEHVRVLLPILAERTSANTIERLVGRTGIPERDIVKALYKLQGERRIEEEINTENGEWYYVAAQDQGGTAGDRRYWSLADRAKEQEVKS